MTNEDVIARLTNLPRGARRLVAKETGLRYGYLSKIVVGEVKNPGAAQIDKLRSYFERQREDRPQ